MGYVTFIDLKGKWRLYRGLGAEGELIKELDPAALLHDISPAQAPLLWVCGQTSVDQAGSTQRVKLHDLSREDVSWSGGRVGAIASAPDGQRCVALGLPSDVGQQPALSLWNGSSWKPIAPQVMPDISSKLAWLDGSRIVYESVERKLTILDISLGNTEVGPSGCCPAAAAGIREWYAIANGRVMRFPFEKSFASPAATLDEFNFGNVTTLRVTGDGNVFTWTEPKWGYRSKAYFQERGKRRRRFQVIDDAIGAVLGPFDGF
jgi:hypothetical protein